MGLKGSRGLRRPHYHSREAWQLAAMARGAAAESSHLKPPTGSWGCGVGICKALETSKPALGDTLLPESPHLQTYPNSVTTWGPSIQRPETMGTSCSSHHRLLNAS